MDLYAKIIIDHPIDIVISKDKKNVFIYTKGERVDNDYKKDNDILIFRATNIPELNINMEK